MAESFTLAIKESATAPPAAAPAGGTVQFIGNATVLIRYQGLTVLTDPNFLHKGDHVHLGYGIHSKRLTNPAVELDKLPPIDLVLLSHFHEDHFDKKVQKQLHRDTPIVSTRESAQHLGGTRILGVLKVTMDGEDGARMLELVAPRQAVPIHYNDYDVFKSQLADFTRAVKAAGLEDKVIYLNHGDSYQFDK